MKHCSKCGIESNNFSPDRTRKDGLASYCRDCNSKLKADWRLRNPDKNKQSSHNWYLENKEHAAKNRKRWKQQNPERLKQLNHEWCRNNLEKRSHNEAKRRARVQVKWGQEGIIEFYKNCPEGYEVDHIIPFQGKLVSGLHVSWNLQYLTPEENLSKLNKCDLVEASKLYTKILIQEEFKEK